MSTEMSALDKLELIKTHITINGYDTYVRYSFREPMPTLVFVHGIGVAGDYFLPLAAELSETYSILIIDLPGYGKTKKPDHALNIHELATVVRTISEHFEIDNATIIGQSMGCQIAAELLHDVPQRFTRGVLLAPTVNRNERYLFLQWFRLMQDILHETIKMDAITLRDYAKMGIIRFVQTARPMLTNHIEDELAKSSQNILIIRGDKDKIVPQNWVDYLVHITPSAQTVTLPGKPHNFHFTAAAETAKIIKNWQCKQPNLS